jgi:hypothetical protein
MNTFTSPLTNILIGSLASPADEGQLRASFEAVGGDSSNLDLLTEHDDVIDHLLSAGGGGSFARFSRRMSMAMDDTAAHRLDSVRRDLSAGHQVMVLHGVDRDSVATMAEQLRALGADNLRYSGRWTSTEHGTAVASVPA